MNPFDVAIVIIITYCLIRGAYRGIIKETTSIIGVVLGVWAAFTFYAPLTRLIGHIGHIFSNPAYTNIFSALLIFAFFFFGSSYLGNISKQLMEIVFLKWVDKTFGAIFGFLKGILISTLLLMVLTTFLSPGASIVKHSVLSPYVSSTALAMSRCTSKDIRRTFRNKLNVTKKSWQKKAKKFVKKNSTEDSVEEIKESFSD